MAADRAICRCEMVSEFGLWLATGADFFKMTATTTRVLICRLMQSTLNGGMVFQVRKRNGHEVQR